ncbi:MAG: hypothetical protein VX899_25060 [Myxococcota bacterium]|nr:hypothetical protein [Myxococcota bacterium]
MRSRTPTERNARFVFGSLPMLMAAFMVASVIGLFVLTRIGGKAAGARVQMTWSTTCPTEWGELLTARGTDMGLGDLEVTPGADEVIVTATLPGLDGDQDKTPALLGARGLLEIQAVESRDSAPGGQVLATNEDVLNAWYQLNYQGHPAVELELQPQALLRLQERDTPALIYVLDGQVVDAWDFEEGPEEDDVRLTPELERTEDEVRQTADWLILLSHPPAPCDATLQSVLPLDPG